MTFCFFSRDNFISQVSDTATELCNETMYAGRPYLDAVVRSFKQENLAVGTRTLRFDGTPILLGKFIGDLFHATTELCNSVESDSTGHLEVTFGTCDLQYEVGIGPVIRYRPVSKTPEEENKELRKEIADLKKTIAELTRAKPPKQSD